MQRINIGPPESPLSISPISLGCWPIAGVTTLGTDHQSSLATVRQALDSGINFFDTAYSYGYDGEADRVLHEALAGQEDVVVASKVGMHFGPERQRVTDGRPGTLKAHAQEALSRLGRESIDILYLHLPDPGVPIADSAGAIAELVQQGVARYAGISNVNANELDAFTQVCPAIISQQPFNLLQQPEHTPALEAAKERSIPSAAYWVLMKGLLAGKLPRDHVFDQNDRRLQYEIFQGQAWQSAQDVLDQLRIIARDVSCTVSQLVIAWTLAHPLVTTCICGAKRPEQIRESAGAMRLSLTDSLIERISALAS
ncbi:MAG: aldo/keto reductase [Aureliella sp.]